MGDYPLFLELSYDPRIWPDRPDDFWHRDVWERQRGEKMNRKAPGTAEQAAMQRQLTDQYRGPAIIKELSILLTVLTNHRFFEYDGEQFWFVTRRDPGDPPENAVWGQTLYRPPGLNARTEEFSSPSTDRAPTVPEDRYYKAGRDELVAGREYQIKLPYILDDLLNVYFGLDAVIKQAFYAACHLWSQSESLRDKAPSLSLIAASSAIETLVDSEGPNPGKPCLVCGAPVSIETCLVCGMPRYYLASRFKKFIIEHGGPGLGRFADRLYGFRSKVSHAGELLRVELFDSGFQTGGKDEQMLFRIDVLRVTHRAIIRWLIAQA